MTITEWIIVVYCIVALLWLLLMVWLINDSDSANYAPRLIASLACSLFWPVTLWCVVRHVRRQRKGK